MRARIGQRSAKQSPMQLRGRAMPVVSSILMMMNFLDPMMMMSSIISNVTMHRVRLEGDG